MFYSHQDIIVNSQKILIDLSGSYTIVRLRMGSPDLPATLVGDRWRFL